MATRPFPAYKGDGPYFFVCYAHDDAEAVYAELERLREQEFNLWYDEGIEPGSQWSDALAAAIERSSALLYFATQSSVASRHCKDEISHALSNGIDILSVHLEPLELDSGLKLALGSRQAILKHELPLERYEALLEDSLSASQVRARSRSEFDIGAHVGGYVVRQLVGEGTFAEVYLADQVEPLRRRVALKVIKLGMDSHEVLARFESERQALAMLDHAHVAKVHDAGMTETGRPFFAMEYVPGEPIDGYCDTKCLDLRQRLELFIQVCKAVQHAHQKGIIHRDIKPSNILVTEINDQPAVKVIDFGVAKAVNQELTERTLHTALGVLIGTPEYMSPEQAGASLQDIDTRSDIYSLGVVLYQLVSGTLPFVFDRATGYGEIRRIITQEEPSTPSAQIGTLGGKLETVAASHATNPRALRSQLQGDLDWITMKALEKDRSRRYETANALGMDVDRHLRNEAILAGPPGVGYRLSKLVRRNRMAFVAGTMTTAAILIGLVTTTLAFIQASDQRDRALVAEADAQQLRAQAEGMRDDAVTARNEAEQARAAEGKARLEAEYKQYVSAIQLAQTQLDRGKVEAAQRRLIEMPKEHRNWEWGYLVNKAWNKLHNEITAAPISDERRGQKAATIWDGAQARVAKRYTDFNEPVSSAYFSHDGRKVSAAGSDGSLAVLYDTDSDERYFGGVALFIRENRISDDGRYQLLHTALGVVAVDERQQKANASSIRLIREHQDPFVFAWFTPDSQKYVTSSANGVVRLYELPSGRELLMLDGFRETTAPDVVFEKDGASMVTSWGRNRVKRWDLKGLFAWADDTGAVTDRPAVEGEAIDGPADSGFFTVRVSPDFRSAASYHPEGKAMVWDIGSGRERFRFDVRQEAPPLAIAFSADGSVLISISPDEEVQLWDVQTGAQLASVPGYNPSMYPPQISPDGARLMIPGTDGAVTMFGPVYESKADRGVLAGHTDWVWSTAFSIDGSRVMTASYDGTAKVWDVATGSELVTLEGHTRPLNAAGWSPDNRFVVTRSWDNTTRIVDEASHELVYLHGNGYPSPNAFGGPRVGPGRRQTNMGRPGFFSPDSSRFIVSSPEGRAEIIDTSSRSTVHTLPGVAGGTFLFQLAFSPDGTLVTAQDIPTGIVRVWNAETGEEIFGTDGDWVQTTRTYISSTGKYLTMLSSGGQIKVLGLKDGTEALSMQGHRGILSAADFNTDDSILATEASDQLVKLWDVSTGDPLATLKGHTGGGINVRFSPDGTRILTLSKDNTAKLWDLLGNELLTLAPSGELFSGNWGPNGLRIALSSDNNAYLYESLRSVDSTKGARGALPFEQLVRLAWGVPMVLPSALDAIERLAGNSIAEGGAAMVEALSLLMAEVQDVAPLREAATGSFHGDLQVACARSDSEQS